MAQGVDAAKSPESGGAPKSEPDAAAQLDFEALQRQFLARLPGRAQRLRSATTSDEALDEWHRLAGAAGSYGQSGLGELARRTLMACRREGRVDAPTDEAVARILSLSLAEFEAALIRLGDPPSA